MKNFLLITLIFGGSAVLMLLGLIAYGVISDPYSLYDIFPPGMESETADQAAALNHLKEGHGYEIQYTGRSGYIVSQNIDSGVIAYAPVFGGASRIFYIETRRKFADGTLLPAPICTVYKGLATIPMVNGSTETVDGFHEISCKPYDPKWLAGE